MPSLRGVSKVHRDVMLWQLNHTLICTSSEYWISVHHSHDFSCLWKYMCNCFALLWWVLLEELLLDFMANCCRTHMHSLLWLSYQWNSHSHENEARLCVSLYARLKCNYMPVVFNGIPLDSGMCNIKMGVVISISLIWNPPEPISSSRTP